MQSWPESRRIARRPPGVLIPLSSAQEQIWLREQVTFGSAPFYNESITIHRQGPLDVAVLEESFSEIIRRHEAWRTTFDTVGSQAIQIIHPARTVTLPVIDLRRLPEKVREPEALRLATDEARRPFDLKRGPLVRALLVCLADWEHRLFITMHQSIADGVSVYQILPSELTILYGAFSAGKPSPLPELPIQYADYAYWQRVRLQREVLANQVAYWRKQLAGELPPLRWPADHPRSAAQTLEGAIQAFTQSKRLTDAVRELSQREGVTVFMALLAAFTALLYRYTEQDDIIVGTVAPAGRGRPEVQGLLGYFLNPVALRMKLSANATFRQLLRQAREVTSGALSNDEVPLECLVEELKPKVDPSRPPFFNLAITLAPPISDLDVGWKQTSMDVCGGAKWDLYLELSERSSGMIGRAQYNPDLFEVATVQRMVGHYHALLEVCTNDPNKRLCELPPDISSRS
jgi:hypothetical protein